MDNQKQPPVTEWTSRRVLVTGVNGFVGRWLTPALVEKGAQVIGLVRSRAKEIEASGPGVEFVVGDINNLPLISRIINEKSIDTVYHLAATNINTGAKISPYEVFETNIRGVYTILEACRTSLRQVAAVIASSKEVEDCFSSATRRKQHPYMTSKAAAELVAKAYHDTFGVPVALVRSDNLYGGGDFNWARLVPGTIRSILHGETPVIRSNGLLERDYVYVEDAIEAYLAIGARLDQPEVHGQLFRVATGKGTSVLDMVDSIARGLGKPNLNPRVLNEKSDERVDVFYTPELEHRMLGWTNRFSLDEGLSRTCQWYRDYFARKIC